MKGELTDTGWPRPIIGGLPIPWVSPHENLAQMNAGRSDACASGAICQVCGLGYREGEEAYVLTRAKRRPHNMRKTKIRAMDNGVLHKRCLLLSLKLCPRLKKLREGRLLHVVRTTGNSAKVRRDRAGKLYASFAGKDCKYMTFKALGL